MVDLQAPGRRHDVTIVMPAFNEEKNITLALSNCLAALDDHALQGEIIVVDDGSRDETAQRVQSVMQRDPRVRLLAHPVNSGIGASFWTGVDQALGEIVTWVPGDNENDPWEILRYHRLLDHVDIVIPFIFNREVRPLFRNGLSSIFRFIINTTFGVNFNYTNGTVLFRKDLLKELPVRNTSFFFQTDILIRTVKQGYLFAEVPYRLGMRKEGVSKAVSFPSLFRVIRGYLNLVKSFYFTKRDGEPHYARGSVTAERRETK